MPRKGRHPALTKEQCLARYGVEKLPSDPKERIAITRPWEKSTGPRTMHGKLMVSRNRLVHGLRSKSLVLSHVARLCLEERLSEEFKLEVAPLLTTIETKIPGFQDMCDRLDLIEETTS